MPRPRVVFSRSKKHRGKHLDGRDVIPNAMEIDRKIRQFKKECAKHPLIAKKLWNPRHYTRWLVSVAATRTYVAPVRYALFSKGSVHVLQQATSGDLVVEGLQEAYRIEEIDSDAPYESAAPICSTIYTACCASRVKKNTKPANSQAQNRRERPMLSWGDEWRAHLKSLVGSHLKSDSTAELNQTDVVRDLVEHAHPAARKRR